MSQKEFWKNESYSYLERNYKGKNLREVEPSPRLVRLLQHQPINIEGGSILDIGCGPANNLHHLARKLGAARGVGVEVSEKAVAELAQAFPEYEFIAEDSASLPFSKDEFNLVLLRGVLCWIDRGYIMQTIGEAIRVCAEYLIISDFAPLVPYSTTYHHNPQYRTYKIAYQPLIEATGLMRSLASLSFEDGDEWKVVQATLYRKLSIDEAFPLRRQEDFACSRTRKGNGQ